MTTLGKILVFTLLLFSLLNSAFDVLVYITRTNWQTGYNGVASRLVRERESHIAAVNARNELEGARMRRSRRSVTS